MMRPTWSAVATRTRLILLLLTVGLLLGNAGAAYSQDTQCSDIAKLEYGKCMPYTYNNQNYFLCNGPYSLCTIADCSPKPPGAKDPTSATCQCKVVESGLSILSAPQSGQITTTSPEVSNFSYAQFPLAALTCDPGTAQVVNCLNMPCTVSSTNPTTSSCTCSVTNYNPAPGQEIFYPPGTTPPSCSPSTLRSGAPLKQPGKPSAKQLDYALTAAMNCVMLQPPPTWQPTSNPSR